jgi:hypothetical protein
VVQYKTHVPPVIVTLLVSRTFQIYNKNAYAFAHKHERGVSRGENFFLRLFRRQVFTAHTIFATLDTAIIVLDFYPESGASEWLFIWELG